MGVFKGWGGGGGAVDTPMDTMWPCNINHRFRTPYTQTHTGAWCFLALFSCLFKGILWGLEVRQLEKKSDTWTREAGKISVLFLDKRFSLFFERKEVFFLPLYRLGDFTVK